MSGLSKPVKCDEVLSALVSKSDLPRTQIIKELWVYIKANNLQDPKNKRTIVADAKLKPLFDGKASINMMQLAKCISNHLVK
jgi:chromatin remodeling complex protein RSC6